MMRWIEKEIRYFLKTPQREARRFIRRNTRKLRRKAPKTIVLLLLIGGFVWWYYRFNRSSAVLVTPPQQEIYCVDGDTFRYGEEKIRLLAIDTPETVAPNKAVEPYGKQASHRTCELLKGASTLTFYYDKGNTEDKYGRKLYWVYVDDVLLQEILISEGLAEIKYVDEKSVDKARLKLIQTAEKEARYYARGLWSQ